MNKASIKLLLVIIIIGLILGIVFVSYKIGESKGKEDKKDIINIIDNEEGNSASNLQNNEKRELNIGINNNQDVMENEVNNSIHNDNIQKLEYKEVMERYIEAIDNNDLDTINKLSKKEIENAEELYKGFKATVKKTEITFLEEKSTDNYVIYSIVISVSNPGLTAYNKGDNTRFLCIEKNDNGEWKIESLATSL